MREFKERISVWISQLRTKSATKTGLIIKLISDAMEKAQEAMKKNEDDDQEARRNIWIATFVLMGVVAAGGFIKMFQSIQKKCNGKKKNTINPFLFLTFCLNLRREEVGR